MTAPDRPSASEGVNRPRRDAGAPPVFGRLAEGTARPAEGEESFTTLLAAGGARVERILSRSAATPPGQWYDQGWTEFVLLVEGAATLAFADGTEHRLGAGDWCILPAHCRHRVTWTASDPPTIWLAIHVAAR